MTMTKLPILSRTNSIRESRILPQQKKVDPRGPPPGAFFVKTEFFFSKSLLFFSCKMKSVPKTKHEIAEAARKKTTTLDQINGGKLITESTTKFTIHAIHTIIREIDAIK